jgi:hypothetical protein
MILLVELILRIIRILATPFGRLHEKISSLSGITLCTITVSLCFLHKTTKFQRLL